MPNTFFDHSAEVACQYLKSVVFLDDEPEYRRKTNAPAQSLDIVGSHPMGEVGVLVPPAESEDHKLLVTPITEAFAEKGIICSFLQPKQDDERWKNICVKLLENADVLILDWDIGGDNGEYIKSVILSLRKKDEGTPEPLRLIIIYSASNTDFLARINEILIDHEGNAPDIKIEPYIQRKYINIGSTRIFVFPKPYTDTKPDLEQYNPPVEPTDIHKEVIKTFASMTNGLISNALLTSLTVIRNNSAKMISRFAKDLDAPFLMHRMCLNEPEESGDMLLELVTEELHAVLDEFDIQSEVSSNLISKWANEKFKGTTTVPLVNIEGLRPPRGSGTKHVTLVKNLVINGINKGINILFKKLMIPAIFPIKDKKRKSTLFTAAINKPASPVGTDAINQDIKLNSKFATLTTTRTIYNKSKYSPILSLGSIVKSDNKYFICLRPRCDSVRLYPYIEENGQVKINRRGMKIKKRYPFLFIQAERTQTPNGSFNLVIIEEEQFVYLNCSKKTDDIHIDEFETSIRTSKETR